MKHVNTLNATQLLDVWEQGRALPPYAQAIVLLSAVFPALPEHELADWSLGRRDAALLDLREQLFGSEIEALAACPACAAQTTLHFQTADIRAPFAVELPALLAEDDGHDFVLHLRPVSTALLRQLRDGRRERLILDCVVEAQRDGISIEAGDLPQSMLERCAELLGEADPQADIRLALSCLECGQHWQAGFDPVSFVWQELDHWAERMLREIHLLASAYGWTEQTILSLSASRRRRYIEMVMA